MAVEPVAVCTGQKIAHPTSWTNCSYFPVVSQRYTESLYVPLKFYAKEVWQLIVYLFIYLAGVSHRPNWPQTLCITKGNRELLVLLPPLPKSWVYKHNPSRLVLYGARYWTLDRHCTN